MAFPEAHENLILISHMCCCRALGKAWSGTERVRRKDTAYEAVMISSFLKNAQTGGAQPGTKGLRSRRIKPSAHRRANVAFFNKRLGGSAARHTDQTEQPRAKEPDGGGERDERDIRAGHQTKGRGRRLR